METVCWSIKMVYICKGCDIEHKFFHIYDDYAVATKQLHDMLSANKVISYTLSEIRTKVLRERLNVDPARHD